MKQVLFTFLLACLATSTAGAQPLIYLNFETDFANKGTGGATYNATVTGNPEAGWTGGTVSRADGSSVRPGGVSGAGLNLVDIDNDQLGLPAGTSALGDSFTISSWYYLSPNSANGSTRYFVFEGENNFDISYGISSGDTYVSYVGQTSVDSTVTSRNAWHHVLHSFSSDGTNTTLNAYIDGQFVGSGSVATSIVDFASVVIGNARTSAGDRQWDGVIDEFAVWNSALGATAATDVYNRGVLGMPVHGVPFADGTIDENVGVDISATGWAGDPGLDNPFMRTQTSGDNTLTLTYSDLPEHTHVDVGMLLAQLDSLDPVRDGDRFIVRLDGETILDAGFGYGVSGSLSQPLVTTGDAALDAELLALRTIEETQLFGDSNFLENVYDLSQLDAFQMIEHTGDTLTLEIIGRQNQSSGEFYGVDNITLQLSNVAVPEPGSLSVFMLVSLIAVVATCMFRRRQIEV